jgi:HSP20 family protein
MAETRDHDTHGAWQWLVNGWHTLRDKALNALTYFSPEQDDQEVSQRWGVVAADVTDHKHSVAVEMELPGMEKVDLSVEVIGDQLVVSGEKRSGSTRREGTVVITERAFGSFRRTIPLPCQVDQGSTKAEYRNGVLKVNLPKDPSGQTRSIPIRRK